MGTTGFMKKTNGLLYRHWHPREGEEFGIKQLIVLKQHRVTVLQVAHEIPLARHMGKKKTINRIMQKFYWPTLYLDVAGGAGDESSARYILQSRTYM